MKENLSLIKYKELTTKEKLILYFLLYAFIGWCLETFYAFTVHGHFVKRGFLYGPICPIYGFGAVLLLINLGNVKKNNFIKFVIAMVAFSIFEFIASWILELIFHQRWWDYSDAMFNIQGRICLSFSILWGFFGLIFINLIHPFVKKYTEKIVKKNNLNMQRTILYSIVVVFIVDVILSSIRYIK